MEKNVLNEKEEIVKLKEKIVELKEENKRWIQTNINSEEKIKLAKWALKEAEEEISYFKNVIKNMEKGKSDYTEKLQSQKDRLKKFLLRNDLWVKFLEFQFEINGNWDNDLDDY